MSLAVTVKLIKNAQSKTLKECLEIEYQLSQRMVYREDFDNGVDSVLISKDQLESWNEGSHEICKKYQFLLKLQKKLMN